MAALKMVISVVVLAFMGVASLHKSAEQPSAAFDTLKSLAGEWEGKMVGGPAGVPPMTTTFKLVADGSTLMNVLASGTPQEMITMFHMDGGDLLATHYCVAHNQPRMRAKPGSDPNVVAFEFKDGTNLSSPEAGHIQEIRITVLDSDHHTEDWIFVGGGKTEVRRFEFHRKQSASRG